MAKRLLVQDTMKLIFSGDFNTLLPYEEFLKYERLCESIRSFLRYSHVRIDFHDEESVQRVIRFFDKNNTALGNDDFFHEIDGTTLIASPNFIIMLELFLSWQNLLTNFEWSAFLKPSRKPIMFYRLFGDFSNIYSTPDNSQAAKIINEFLSLSEDDRDVKVCTEFGRELSFQEMIVDIAFFCDNIFFSESSSVPEKYVNFLSQFSGEGELRLYENQYIIEYIFLLNVLGIDDLYLTTNTESKSLMISNMKSVSKLPRNKIFFASHLGIGTGFLEKFKETTGMYEVLEFTEQLLFSIKIQNPSASIDGNLKKTIDSDLEKLTNELYEALSKFRSVRVSIDTKKGVFDNAKIEFQANLSQFIEVKDFIDGNGQVSPHEYKGIKTHIAGIKRIDFDKEDN